MRRLLPFLIFLASLGFSVRTEASLSRHTSPLAYDADGNVTNDGHFTHTWNSENQLTSVVSLTNSPAESKRRLTFGYDYQGRRITKAVESWTGSTWTMTASNKFVYDGWNLLAELNATNNAVIRSYMWGLDLSGSLQGAGGVGGLLAVTDAVNGTHFFANDGNGNVAALVQASDGTISANYEYGPFGETLRATGLMASANPFRFSTKYQDNESDQIYYGYRYYSASMGRWLSRDPLEEQGGLNRYGFVGNDHINATDLLGLYSSSLNTSSGAGVMAWLAEQAAIGAKIGAATGAFGELARQAGASAGGECNAWSLNKLAGATLHGAAWGAASGPIFGGLGRLVSPLLSRAWGVTIEALGARAAKVVDPQLDANFLINLWKNEPNAIAFARANQAAGLSYNFAARQEFLAAGLGTRAQLRALESRYGISLIREIPLPQIEVVALRLQAAFNGTRRVLSFEDARIAATAFIKSERFATFDMQFFKRGRDLGLQIEFVPLASNPASAATAARYVPQPVIIK